MTEIVLRKRGTLDKYIGDAVMAFFGAPVQTAAHAANGCDAALEMIETLQRMRERWRIEEPSMEREQAAIACSLDSQLRCDVHWLTGSSCPTAIAACLARLA